MHRWINDVEAENGSIIKVFVWSVFVFVFFFFNETIALIWFRSIGVSAEL